MAIRDNSYETVRYGRVRSYSGYEVLGEPGSRVLRVGILAGSWNSGKPTSVRGSSNCACSTGSTRRGRSRMPSTLSAWRR